MTVRHLAIVILALAACDGGRSHNPGNGNGSGDGGIGTVPGPGTCDPNNFEIPNNGFDDNCDGLVDNVSTCDTGVAGQNTSDALVKAIGICDSKFVTGSKFNGPSNNAQRYAIGKLGIVAPLEGAAMGYISSGDASGMAGYIPQPGTDFGEQSSATQFPYLSLDLNSAVCGDDNPGTLYDYAELEVDLTVPNNANSFSFQTQFFSAEYPEYVCMGFNDRFLVVLDTGTGAPMQIEYDMTMNPVTVNNGFFTVCTDSSASPQTQHCTKPVSQIMGTGFDQADPFNPFDNTPIGGSTGWLTTTAPVPSGAHIKLRFIIFDEGDGILDSSALIDNFKWLPGMTAGPVTIQ